MLRRMQRLGGIRDEVKEPRGQSLNSNLAASLWSHKVGLRREHG